MCRGSGVPGNSTTVRGKTGRRESMLSNLAGIVSAAGSAATARRRCHAEAAPRSGRKHVGRQRKTVAARRTADRLRSPLRRAPEPAEGPNVRRVAQLLERALPDLPDALAGDAQELP